MRGDVVVGGLPAIPGETVFEKKLYLEHERPEFGRVLMFEPRGPRGVNFIVPATDPEASFGYVIAEPTEYPAMSGTNTMCVITVLLETGMIPMLEPATEVVVEAPAGLIRARCTCADGKVTQVSFLNQPAFVYHHQAPVEVEGIGTVVVDVAWGGMCYVLVDAASLGFSISLDESRDLVRMGQIIKGAAAEQLEAVHPLEPRNYGITQTEFTGPLVEVDGALRSKNAVIISPGSIDRSPCGTGTSARLAVLHARGEIAVGQPFIHDSILDTTFHCSIESTTTVGPYPAVSPRIGGQAWITSLEQAGVDVTDPFPEGLNVGTARRGPGLRDWA